MWIQTGKERQIVINYIKMRGEDFSYTNFHSVVPVEEDKDGFVTIAKKFRKQILMTSFSTNGEDVDSLLNKFENFALQHKNCDGVIREYEESIVDFFSNPKGNFYSDTLIEQRKRYSRFKDEFPEYSQKEPADWIILDGIANSHIIVRNDGTNRTLEDAMAVYQGIYNELTFLNPDKIHEGYLLILYGIARDSFVYSDTDALSFYQHFEDLLFERMHHMCTQIGEIAFGEKYLMNILFLFGLHFNYKLYGTKDRSIINGEEGMFRILRCMDHFLERLFDEFTFVLTDDYQAIFFHVGDDIKKIELKDFYEYLSPEEIDSCMSIFTMKRVIKSIDGY